MKEGFFLRVCSLCLDRQGKVYAYMSVYGCRTDETVFDCKTCNKQAGCDHIISNTDEKVTHGYCQCCVDEYYANKP